MMKFGSLHVHVHVRYIRLLLLFHLLFVVVGRSYVEVQALTEDAQQKEASEIEHSTSACLMQQVGKKVAHVVDWHWMGALTSTSIRFKLGLAQSHGLCGKQVVDLVVSGHLGLAISIRNAQHGFQELFPAVSTTYAMVYDIKVNGLPQAGTEYDYEIVSYMPSMTSNQTIEKQGTFRTSALGPFNFTFAMSSCADEDSDPRVFDAIAAYDPLFFLHMGDLHYHNIDINDMDVYRRAYYSIFNSPAGRSMLGMDIPFVYMWDDHDFGPDNSDGTAPGRESALRTYREFTPHYPLAPSSKPWGPIQQAFTVGRVRFLVTDLRSERTPNSAFDTTNKTVLGKEQKVWFKDQLMLAQQDVSIGCIVWVSTMPWLDDQRKWGHFQTEQTELVAFMTENKIIPSTQKKKDKDKDKDKHEEDKHEDEDKHEEDKQDDKEKDMHLPKQATNTNSPSLFPTSTQTQYDLDERPNSLPRHQSHHLYHLRSSTSTLTSTLTSSSLPVIIVAGDAHMIAVDDGSHSPGGLPVFHAAALGRKGSIKGGPYSHGAFPGTGQFAVVEVHDFEDGRLCVHFTGRNLKHEIILEYDTCHPESTPGQPYYPPPQWVRTWGRGIKKIAACFNVEPRTLYLVVILLPLSAMCVTILLFFIRHRYRRKDGSRNVTKQQKRD